MEKNFLKAQAHVKMQRISAQKARLVAALIKKQPTTNALAILHNTNKKAALLFIKLLNSAIANAVNNHGLDGDKLIVEQVLVNEGPTLKRFQPRSKGVASQILKRTSHLSITVAQVELGDK
ncbi:50S ribosomal protein L22 [Mesomycoplasma conjunctivae]|uniref:Large ribosomal subunit protein uL22 n=1 Tax=Mesomycoplasma conjunctivae (strain ATCC 25834 / NCTC 10147 / HRC/581) TaxID=572263 RepID=C5J5T7_MESCH|nr:50S ribosomal protein L22 [Mesomycoplasma conjunctivae]CAT04826.1 50S ribosomal protein L22 [Mesomycoplasma conjunctivae]VEU65867.1 50S ribosomal protein L22 [Mesomycoplasma conjunctivae]